MLLMLLTLIKDENDKDKFIALYNKYRLIMLKVAYEYVHDYSLAEDCVQSAFCDIAKNFSNVGDVDSNRTAAYILTITRTCSIKIFHSEIEKSAVYFEDLPFEIEDENQSDEEFFRKYNVDMVMNLVYELPDLYREPLLLQYVHNYDGEHIAQLMNTNSANIRKRIQRAKQMIREKLKTMEML